MLTLYKLLGVVLVLHPAYVMCQVCEAGWSTLDGTCYKLYRSYRNWYEANTECQLLGGTLAMPKTSAINTFLTNMIRNGWSNPWIGVHDVPRENMFMFVDGSPVTTQFWGPHEPNNAGYYQEDCVQIYHVNGNWNDLYCARNRPYICERIIDFVSACDVNGGWRSAAGRCYKLYDQDKSWLDAENYCTAVDGHLVSFGSESERQSVMQFASSNTVWIGLRSPEDIDVYQWSSGDQLSYTYWATNEPATRFSNRESCGEIIDVTPGGKWSAMTCSVEQNFICERAEGTCPDGWHLYRGYCYQLNTHTKVSWVQAKHTCEAQGAYLVTLLSNVENNYIRDMFVDLEANGITATWIGISDVESDSHFAWVGESSVLYTNWDTDQPTDNSGSADCGSMTTTAGRDGHWSTKDCDTVPEAFVCKIKAGQPIHPLDPSIGIGQCESGWTLNGDHCYKVIEASANFHDAESGCIGKGGHLASVNNQDEQAFLSQRVDLAGRYLYIGLNDKATEGTYEWTDSSEVTYTHWAPGQPDQSSDDCVFIKYEEDFIGQWQADDCTLTKAYVCKKAKRAGSQEPAVLPTPLFDARCGNGWEYDQGSGTCYLFRPTDYKNWDDARIECKLDGGDLLSIANDDEERYVAGRLVYVTESMLWIGANDLSNEGGWQWNDDTAFAYVNWNQGEPNNAGSGEHCANLYMGADLRHLKWNDLFCDRELGYICEKNGYLTTHYTVDSNGFLDGSDDAILTNRFPEDCARICYRRGDDCRSFNYNRATRECKLSATSKDQPGQRLLGSSSYDYYQRLMNVVDPVPTSIPSGYRCGADWTDYGNYCYRPLPSSKTMSTARDACQGEGADLVSIHDFQENLFVFILMYYGDSRHPPLSPSTIWLGLNDLETSKTYKWTDGSPADYTRWDNHEPNDWPHGLGMEDCVQMYSNGAWNDLSCDSLLPSICKKRKEDLGPTDIPVTPSGCSLGEDAYGAYCYSVVTDAKSWATAKIDCVGRGGNLASIADRYEQALVSSILGQQDGSLVWIGLSDQGSQGEYSWSDRTEVTFTHWDFGQPVNTDDSRGSCTAATSGTAAGLWRNNACESSYKALCKRLRTGEYTPRPTLPYDGAGISPASNLGCSDGWVGYGNSCFKVEETRSATWNQARENCVELGGDLASFHDPAEEQRVKSIITTSNGRYWIGLHDKFVENGFVWSDDTPVDHTSWNGGEPNDAGRNGEDCVELIVARGWNDLPCDSYKRWICKMPKDITPSAVLPPTTAVPWPQCPSDPDWVLFRGSCYFFSAGLGEPERAMNYTEASAYCASKDSSLVSVHTSAVNDFLQFMVDRFVDENNWIGLRAYEGSGFYSWSDDSPLDFHSWNSTYPRDDDGARECAQFNKLDGTWSNRDCGDKLTFACKKEETPSSPVTNTPISSEGNCPTGTSRFDNKCYVFVGEDPAARKTRANARTYCMNTFGGELAIIQNSAVQSFFISQMNDVSYKTYIGLVDSLNSGKFYWTDQTPVGYTNWNANEPSNHIEHGLEEDRCVSMAVTPPERAGKWDVESCLIENGFICQTSLDVNAPTPPPSTPNACRQGYAQYGNSCFKINPRLMTFSDAVQACRNQGPDVNLASISDINEQAFAETLVHNNGDVMLWLGLLDDKISGQYSWVDRRPVWYTNWGQGEPSKQGGEGCTAMGLDGWDDHQCEDQLGALCKYSLVVTPTEHPDVLGVCPDTWVSYGTNCYWYPEAAPGQSSWHTAKYVCKGIGGHLASIHTMQENEWIRKRLGQEYTKIWIGFESNPTVNFTWTDESALDFTNWNPGQPSAELPGEEDCTEMDGHTGKWNDESCMTSQGFVCKRPKVLTLSTTMPNITKQVKGTSSRKYTAISAGESAGVVIAVLAAIALVSLLGFYIYTSKFRITLPLIPRKESLNTPTGFENVVYDGKNGASLRASESST